MKFSIPIITIKQESDDDVFTDALSQIQIPIEPVVENNASKFVFFTKLSIDNSTSCITWFHSPREEKKEEERFAAFAEITLIPGSNFDLMSPDLRKLCERFEKLQKRKDLKGIKSNQKVQGFEFHRRFNDFYFRQMFFRKI